MSLLSVTDPDRHLGQRCRSVHRQAVHRLHRSTPRAPSQASRRFDPRPGCSTDGPPLRPREPSRDAD
jgi:hypothetical protein